jgi:hypothetical protein
MIDEYEDYKKYYPSPRIVFHDRLPPDLFSPLIRKTGRFFSKKNGNDGKKPENPDLPAGAFRKKGNFYPFSEKNR